MKVIILFMMIPPILLAKTDSTQVGSIQIDCSQNQWLGQDKVLHTTGSVGLVLGLNEIVGNNAQSALKGTFTIGIIIGFLFILNTG